MRPDKVVDAAAALRAEHYLIGHRVAAICAWPDLTDAQKVPWILKAAAAETRCTCNAPPGAEHPVGCPLYEPPLTQEEIRRVRSLLSEETR